MKNKIRFEVVAAEAFNLFVWLWVALMWSTTNAFWSHLALIGFGCAMGHLTYVAFQYRASLQEIREQHAKDYWPNHMKRRTT